MNFDLNAWRRIGGAVSVLASTLSTCYCRAIASNGWCCYCYVCVPTLECLLWLSISEEISLPVQLIIINNVNNKKNCHQEIGWKGTRKKHNWIEHLSKLLSLVRLYDLNDQCNADKSSFRAYKILRAFSPTLRNWVHAECIYCCIYLRFKTNVECNLCW